MLHDERVTYTIIKSWVLATYYDGCRDHALVSGWSHEQIIGFVDYQFEVTFERFIEQVMYKVVLLILSGGWYPIQATNLKNSIILSISEHGLDNLLENVPDEEADLFKHDLAILKLL